jgi:hypothetical protein
MLGGNQALTVLRNFNDANKAAAVMKTAGNKLCVIFCFGDELRNPSCLADAWLGLDFVLCGVFHVVWMLLASVSTLQHL